MRGLFSMVNRRVWKAFTGGYGWISQHQSGVTVERYHGLSYDTPLLLEF